MDGESYYGAPARGQGRPGLLPLSAMTSVPWRRVGPAVLIAAVVALVAVNVARRPDDAPVLAEGPLPEGDVATQEDAPLMEQALHRNVPPPVQEDEMAAEAEALEAEPAPAPEAAPAPEPAVADTPAARRPTLEATDGDCAHPFVPSAVGTWRRYRWTQNGSDQAAILRFDADRVEESDEGQRRVRWRMRIESVEDGTELAATTLDTWCRPGEDAEEPWFGILERAMGLRMLPSPDRWRWPAALRPEVTFEGEVRFDPRGAPIEPPRSLVAPTTLTITRRHAVVRREEVTVPAGTWDAWRVDYEERHSFAQRGEEGPGTLWVAPGVGLVRMRAENSRGQAHALELAGMGDP
jgi:hypothetical protein